MAKKRCLFCREWFLPYAPAAERALICGEIRCKRKLKRMLDRAWRRRNPKWCWEWQAWKRAWAARRRYYPWYRQTHPAYVARDNKRRARAQRRQRWGVMSSFEV